MKRLIPLLLVLFLLAGCKSKSADLPTVSPTVLSDISCTYEENSQIEQQTNGAVRVYSLDGEFQKLGIMDDGIILSDEQGRMLRLSGKEGILQASSSLEMEVLSVSEQQVVGYITDSRTVVVMDKLLQQVSSYVLEEGVAGTPVAGIKTNEIYYCVGDYIRALSFDTGLTRHVMQFVPGSQKLIACYFGGELLGWDDGERTLFLSSKDGQTVYQSSSLNDFQTGTDTYYGVYLDGFVEQIVWGKRDGEPMQLELSNDEALYPQVNASIVVTAQAVDSGLCFRRYDMTTGRRTASVCIPTSRKVLDISASETSIWILTEQALYQWDSTQTADSDDVVYYKPLITAQNPDKDGLAESEVRAQEIGQSYGIDIHIWENALLNDETYMITGEYQIETINAMLDALEVELAKLPAQIFTPTEEYCGIQLCLVRSIEGQNFIQYWADGGLCIAVTPTANLQEALLTGLGWGIDSCVIGHSRDLDYWDDLNPDGFTYDYSYFVNAQRTDLQYLEGENRAFTDQRAMSFPSEDRARIFYYAMTEGNEELFASPVLQAKLRTFCEGIREAYGWQKEVQSFPWEQYLEESLAYSK